VGLTLPVSARYVHATGTAYPTSDTAHPSLYFILYTLYFILYTIQHPTLRIRVVARRALRLSLHALAKSPPPPMHLRLLLEQVVTHSTANTEGANEENVPDPEEGFGPGPKGGAIRCSEGNVNRRSRRGLLSREDGRIVHIEVDGPLALLGWHVEASRQLVEVLVGLQPVRATSCSGRSPSPVHASVVAIVAVVVRMDNTHRRAEQKVGRIQIVREGMADVQWVTAHEVKAGGRIEEWGAISVGVVTIGRVPVGVV